MQIPKKIKSLFKTKKMNENPKEVLKRILNVIQKETSMKISKEIPKKILKNT